MVSYTNQLAYQKGLHLLQSMYQVEHGYQCFVSATPDMRNPVQSPAAYLYHDLAEFPPENFSNMVIFDLLFRTAAHSTMGQTLLAHIQRSHTQGIFYFFQQPDLIPADVDSTALGVTVLAETGRIARHDLDHAVQAILANTNESGVIEVYLPPWGHRHYVDLVVCANALYLLSLIGRAQDAQATADFVADHLCLHTDEATRYYSPDLFLYFVSRLVARFPHRWANYKTPLQRAVRSRQDATHTPIDTAARVIAAKRVGIASPEDEERLRQMQMADGGWPADVFYSFGRKHGYFGGRAIATAFATKAIGMKVAFF